MKLIIGLGNPGSRYEATRHNAGRAAVEFFAREHSLKFEKKKSLKAQIAKLDWDEVSVTLAIPDLFMNESGVAVNLLVRHFEISFKTDLLVLIDEVALPFGKLRLRGKGSAGGHNGLKSVEAALGSQDYARLRIGVGANLSPAGLADYVLSRFQPEELKALPSVLEKTYEACRIWSTQPLARAMNAVN